MIYCAVFFAGICAVCSCVRACVLKSRHGEVPVAYEGQRPAGDAGLRGPGQGAHYSYECLLYQVQ